MISDELFRHNEGKGKKEEWVISKAQRLSPQITLISNQPKFTFVPSLPWVGLGLKSLDRIQLDLAKIVPQHGI